MKKLMLTYFLSMNVVFAQHMSTDSINPRNDIEKDIWAILERGPETAIKMNAGELIRRYYNGRAEELKNGLEYYLEYDQFSNDMNHKTAAQALVYLMEHLDEIKVYTDLASSYRYDSVLNKMAIARLLHRMDANSTSFRLVYDSIPTETKLELIRTTLDFTKQNSSEKEFDAETVIRILLKGNFPRMHKRGSFMSKLKEEYILRVNGQEAYESWKQKKTEFILDVNCFIDELKKDMARITTKINRDRYFSLSKFVEEYEKLIQGTDFELEE